MTVIVTGPSGRRDRGRRDEGRWDKSRRDRGRPGPVLPVPPDDVEKYAYLNRSLPYLSAWLIAGFVCLIASQVITEVRVGVAVVLAPFTALYAVYQLISLPVNFTGRGFNLSAHRRKVRAAAKVLLLFTGL
jgi:hypothetical protein